MRVFILLISKLCVGLCYFKGGQTQEAFILNNGVIYRDVETLEASRAAANFAHNYEFDVVLPTERKQRILPDFVRTANFSFGQRKSAEEIFDFLDSRFLNPPAENSKARPTFVNSEVNLESEVEHFLLSSH